MISKTLPGSFEYAWEAFLFGIAYASLTAKVKPIGSGTSRPKRFFRNHQ